MNKKLEKLDLLYLGKLIPIQFTICNNKPKVYYWGLEKVGTNPIIYLRTDRVLFGEWERVEWFFKIYFSLQIIFTKTTFYEGMRIYICYFKTI